MSELLNRIDAIVERLLCSFAQFRQCKARYEPNVGWLERVYCVKHRYHFGPHRDNRGEWKP